MTTLDPELRKRLEQEVILGGFRAQAAIEVLTKYSPDQPRDSHGRFGSGGGSSDSDTKGDGTKEHPIDGTKMSPGEIADHMKAGEHIRINPEQTPDLMSHVDSLGRNDNPYAEAKMNYLHYGDGKDTFSRFDDGLYGRGASGDFAGMPQLDEDNRPGVRDEYFDKLRSEGVKVEEAEVDPRTLQPMQNETGLAKTAGILEHANLGHDPDSPSGWKSSDRIIVSNDGYVIDGHHRLSAMLADAATNPDAQIGVVRVDMSHDELLAHMQQFNKEIGQKPMALGQDGAQVADNKQSVFKGVKEILPGIPDDGSEESERVKAARDKQSGNPHGFGHGVQWRPHTK